MDTNKIDEMYNKIFNAINEMIPEVWDNVLLYTEQEEGCSSFFFYYYKLQQDMPIYVFDIKRLFNVDIEKFNNLKVRIAECLNEVWWEFANQKQDAWTNMTMKLYSTGKFDVKYDYTVFDEDKADIGERRLLWEYSNIGIIPTNKYDIEFLKKYLNKEEL